MRYAMVALVLALAGCGDATGCTPVERTVTFMMQGEDRAAIDVLRNDFGAACERTERTAVMSGTFIAGGRVYRETWSCSWCE